MLDKLAKAFGLLRQDVASLRGDVQRIEKVRQVVKHGRDGVSPDPDDIVATVLAKIEIPKDGISPDLDEVAAAAAKLVPPPEPGRDAVAPLVRDVADVVLAKIERPKDGISPDLNAVAAAAAKLVPVPKDGISPTAAAVAKRIPKPQRGLQGLPGKDGVSVTGVSLESNELFVSLDGKKQSAGKIKLPAVSAAFRPGQGDGGGARTVAPFYAQQVVVREAAQLSGELRSDVMYFLDGVIDFTGTGFSVTVPADGLNLLGHSAQLSGLTCADDNFTLFSTPGGGDFRATNMLFTTSGVNSQVYDITSASGLNTFETRRVNYVDCASLGEITSYLQGLMSDGQLLGGRPELTLSGTWLGGFVVDVSIARGLLNGVYSTLKAGPGFVMHGRFRSNQNLALPADASFFDFAPANFVNPSTLQLAGCFISRDGVVNSSDPNIAPNITPGDLVCEWMGNNGIGNTFVGGEMNVTTEIETVISTAEVFEDLAGTWTSAELQHFDEPANGQLRHLGDSPASYLVDGQLVLDAGANDPVDVKVVLFRAATSTFEDGKTVRRVINSLQGGRNVGYFRVSDSITLNRNDYVKLQVANVDATTNITAELDSFIRVSAR